MLRLKGWKGVLSRGTSPWKGVERRGNMKSSRNLKFEVTRWFMCGEVVGGEATPYGFSPENTGETWKDSEQQGDRVGCIL